LYEANPRVTKKGTDLPRRVEKEMRNRGEEQGGVGHYKYLQYLMAQPTVLNV
jgi:hypothetical protein